MSFEENIKKNNIVLPNAADPVGAYVASKIVNNLLYISGQISMDENGKLIKGKVGQDLNTDQAYKAAERCALSIAAQAKKACNNDLSKIKSCIKLTGFVNSTDEFTEQPKVINGASDTIAKIFGDSGVKRTAEEFSKDFLGEIPINPEVGKASDNGKPIVELNSEHEISKIYLNFANKIKSSYL